MKLKKTIATVAAAVTALTVCASAFSACKKECEHNYKWTTLTPATCTTTGEEQGLCGLCGNTTEREIPVSNEHPYGEWDITAPTETAEGKAVKTCTRESSHKLEVTLSVVTEAGTGYDSSALTKPATSISKGERTFVLKNDAGDISFIVYTPEKDVETVEDAVLIGASKMQEIRSASGQYSADTTRFPIQTYMYEFGDNYMHFEESGDQRKIWCSLDEEGNPYLIKTENGGAIFQDTAATADYMNGFTFSLGYSFGTIWYGAENLLSSLYSIATENTNKDFDESVGTASGGGDLYRFQFGTHSEKYYSDIKVEFTLHDNFAIKTLTVNTEVYDKGNWELDEETLIARPTTNTPSGKELITVETVARTPGDVEPENPYKKENFTVKSFDLFSGATQITDETVITLSADSTQSFNIRNVVHFNEEIPGNIVFDPVSYFLRTEAGDEPVTFEAGYDGIAVWTSNNTQVNVRSFKTGNLTLVVKTASGQFERTVKLDVKKIAPPATTDNGGVAYFPSVYLFGGETYYWQSLAAVPEADRAQVSKTFVNQPLRFKADIAKTLTSYVDPSADAEITSANAADASIEEVDGEENVYSFTATKAGVYTIQLTSKLNKRLSIYLPITVETEPPISTVLTGEYKGSLQYPSPNGVTVKFNSNGAATGTVAVTIIKYDNATGKNVEVGTEKLNYVWDAATRKLTTTHASGADDKKLGFGFKLALNDAFNLVVMHPSGVGDETETVVLYKH